MPLGAAGFDELVTSTLQRINKGELFDQVTKRHPTLDWMRSQEKSATGRELVVNLELAEDASTQSTDDSGSFSTEVSGDILGAAVYQWSDPLVSSVRLRYKRLKKNQGRQQVLNLLKDLQAQEGVSYLLVAHNLATVRYLAHEVAVMYLGTIVELAPRDAIFEAPSHPYTRALLWAIPVPDPSFKKDRMVLQGDVPSPYNPPSGCRFRTRCPYAEDVCARIEPPLAAVGERARGQLSAAARVRPRLIRLSVTWHAR
jgi:oligopeptide/dipeptide ABC transporter ATP-binding protein